MPVDGEACMVRNHKDIYTVISKKTYTVIKSTWNCMQSSICWALMSYIKDNSKKIYVSLLKASFWWCCTNLYKYHQIEWWKLGSNYWFCWCIVNDVLNVPSHVFLGVPSQRFGTSHLLERLKSYLGKSDNRNDPQNKQSITDFELPKEKIPYCPCYILTMCILDGEHGRYQIWLVRWVSMIQLSTPLGII